MKKWTREILSEIGLFLIYVKDILMGGIAAALIVWIAILAICMSLTNETMGIKDTLTLYIPAYLISTIILFLVRPFDEWEEDYIQECEENNNEELEDEK